MIVDYIDGHRQQFGVEPICRVLRVQGVSIAPSSYYAARTRPRSARAERDERVLGEIRRVHAHPELGRGLYGARKAIDQHGWPNDLRPITTTERACTSNPTLVPFPLTGASHICGSTARTHSCRQPTFTCGRPQPRPPYRLVLQP
ncbi:hypothetical protein AD017_32215 (plasmid) [Pseudonocardia sp. EC080619-01]|nr:hypothetical protein AD017_32215 [Pseudonocardia sp. EC080619-01]